MKLENKRIFVDNLPQTITQNQLEQKFSEYGTVSSVEIKKRKADEAGREPQFAYVTLTIGKSDLSNCLEEFSSNKWKGHWINVQEAKESFLDRLKRERLEQSSSTSVSLPSPPTSKLSTDNSRDVPKENSNNNYNKPKSSSKTSYVNNNFSKSSKVYHSSSSEEDETPKQNTFKEKPITRPTKRKDQAVDDSFITAPKEKSNPISQSDQKRLDSMAQMRKTYQQQKQFLKAALSSIDSKPKNKIIFDENGDFDATPAKKTKHSSGVAENKRALFDDEQEGEDDYNFEVRKQFEGKAGQKLTQLQTRFKNDKRFAMDERFLEEDKDDVTPTVNESQEDEMTLDKEKQKELEILGEVLGKPVKSKLDKGGNQNHKMMLRFDPSQPTHSKFEIKNEKKKKQDKAALKVVEEKPLPDVSKETFYKIAVDLKDALHEKQEFSLANLFSKQIEDVEQETVDENVAPTNQKVLETNEPFHYDSSENEEDTPNGNAEAPAVYTQKVGPAKIWTESFFFKPDDYRLQEGLDFIKRLEVDDQSDFTKLRRNLHEIVRAKVRNNQRKNRPFRRKLGGKKRLRVKRAMKR